MPSIINATTTNGVAISPDNSGSLQLATNNGTTAVTINTSQNVGIGTTSPSQKLDVRGDARFGANARIQLTESAGDAIIGGTAGTNFTAFTVNNTERMRITSGGLVGIGSTNPDQMLVIRKDSASTSSGEYPVIDLRNDNASGFNQLRYMNGTTEVASILASNADSSLRFRTNSSVERMRITSDGEVLINTSDIAGTAFLQVGYDGTGNNAMVIRNTGGYNAYTVNFLNSSSVSAGGIYMNSASSVSYVTSSDYRLKENIAPMTGALSKVAQLKPVTYTWKTDGSAGQGFIAHELQAVVPDCVVGEKDAVDADGKPVYQGVDTSFLVATLTAAIQEQQAQIEELKQEVQLLKNPPVEGTE